jgi:hypothetical protein
MPSTVRAIPDSFCQQFGRRMGSMDDTTFPFAADRPERALTDGHASWRDLVAVEPELGAAVRARLESTKHHVLATLRSDGAPRVSGTEVILFDGLLAIGSMWGAVKALDLRRDGRFALHANPGDGSMEGGDAKLSGTAVELSGASAVAIADHLSAEAAEAERPEVPEPFHLFRLDLSQVVLSEVDHERGCMVIRSWWPDRGLVVAER